MMGNAGRFWTTFNTFAANRISQAFTHATNSYTNTLIHTSIIMHTDKLRPTPTDAHQKPRTSAVVARRMVAGALGVRVKVSKEQQEKERRELQAARGRY